MYILALESAGKAGSVAAADGARLIAQQTLDPRQGSAQSMVPAIRRLLDAAGWRPAEVKLIAVVIGPGSFTGLRVGVATAKTLGYALGTLVVGVNTLDVIAAQAATSAPRLSVALDAQRGQVFCATYERAAKENDSPWSLIDGPRIEDEVRWLSSLQEGSAVSGPALARLVKRVPGGVTVIDEKDWAPRADTVAALAWARHLNGAYDDVWKLTPLYIRKSAAEEKLEVRRN